MTVVLLGDLRRTVFIRLSPACKIGPRTTSATLVRQRLGRSPASITRVGARTSGGRATASYRTAERQHKNVALRTHAGDRAINGAGAFASMTFAASKARLPVLVAYGGAGGCGLRSDSAGRRRPDEDLATETTRTDSFPPRSQAHTMAKPGMALGPAPTEQHG